MNREKKKESLILEDRKNDKKKSDNIKGQEDVGQIIRRIDRQA